MQFAVLSILDGVTWGFVVLCVLSIYILYSVLLEHVWPSGTMYYSKSSDHEFETYYHQVFMPLGKILSLNYFVNLSNIR